jgi:hypothetical protein
MGYLYLTLVLYAISFGFLGFSLFSFFVRMDKKKGVIGIIIGLVLLGAAMSLNKIPKENAIIVGEVETSSNNNEYVCTIKGENMNTEYVYVDEDKNVIEDFCSRFEIGKEYKLRYTFKNDKYVISKINP